MDASQPKAPLPVVLSPAGEDIGMEFIFQGREQASLSPPPSRVDGWLQTRPLPRRTGKPDWEGTSYSLHKVMSLFTSRDPECAALAAEADVGRKAAFLRQLAAQVAPTSCHSIECLGGLHLFRCCCRWAFLRCSISSVSFLCFDASPGAFGLLVAGGILPFNTGAATPHVVHRQGEFAVCARLQAP